MRLLPLQVVSRRKNGAPLQRGWASAPGGSDKAEAEIPNRRHVSCRVSIPVREMRAADAAGMAVSRGNKPEPPAGGNVAWLGSSTISATNNGPRSELLGGGCAYCGATDKPLQRDAYSRSPVAGDTRSTTCRPAPPATPASATTKSRAGSGEAALPATVAGWCGQGLVGAGYHDCSPRTGWTCRFELVDSRSRPRVREKAT
jgi:hypothetical protein